MITAQELLSQLIPIPSFSGQEHATADLLNRVLIDASFTPSRVGNNVYCQHRIWKEDLPVLWLCSHHDTVRPAAGYTRNPHQAEMVDGRLYGLGSNDAGGALSCMVEAFLQWQPQIPKFNLALALVAEEETSGPGGITLLLQHVPQPAMAIVGEPTSLQAAVAEKGLLVVDAVAHGVAGHAARLEGDNALYKAIADIEWIRQFLDPNPSELLGPLRLTVTQFQGGKQHNLVPDRAEFVVDIRLTERWTHQQVLDLLGANLSSEIKPRSTRLRASGIDKNHPIVQAIAALGIPTYGSPTMSDMALLPCPAIKLGPGDSARSHTADEWIGLDELEAGTACYLRLLTQLSELL